MGETLPHEYQEQQKLLESLLRPHPTVIGLEGGPCGGKSTLLAEVERQAVETGRKVVVLGEAATPRIAALEAEGKSVPGIAKNDRSAYLQFQENILVDTIQNLENALSQHAHTDAVIIMDRCDIGAYVSIEEHRAILGKLGRKVAPMHEYVDQLYYLPSVARVQPEQYEALQRTNYVRYEDTDQAVARCKDNLDAVHDHPELHVVWGGDFNQKIQKAVQAILSPEHESEIKRTMPNREAFRAIGNSLNQGNLLVVHHINQSYHVLGGQEFRLRIISSQYGRTSYFLSIKEGEGTLRKETQRRLNPEEYMFLRETPQIGKELCKRRHVFLDMPRVGTTERRLWFADEYDTPRLKEWHFETDIAPGENIEELQVLYGGVLQQTDISARDLIFIEQT
jgi:thymidylate kinase